MTMTWKRLIPTAALGGLACLALFASAEPADAKKNTCLARFNSCTYRCAVQYKDYVPCVYRTCNTQYNNCAGEGGGKGRLAASTPTQAPQHTTGQPTPPTGPTPRPLPTPTTGQPTPSPAPTPTTGQPKPLPGPVTPAPTTGTNTGGRPVVANVRDHRAPRAQPTVRDHRAQPVVRDHRPQPTVRDHRGGGAVRSAGRR